MYYFQVFSIIGSLVIFAVVIDFIRRGLLKEKYSVLWLASSVVMLVLSLQRQILDSVSGFIGIAYPPSLLFLVAFIFLLLITLHFSVVISIMHERNKTLAQDLALLKNALEESGVYPPRGVKTEAENSQKTLDFSRD
jgi:hypothetical protein